MPGGDVLLSASGDVLRSPVDGDILLGTGASTPPPPGHSGIAWANADAFLSAALHLLPRGEVWPDWLPPEFAVQPAFWQAVADRLAELHARAAALSEIESDPAQTVELLESWESDYGLPDICTPATPTLTQRRAALLTKIAAHGVARRSYFIGIAQTLGYAITIVVTAPNQWTVHAPTATVNYFRVGESTAGEPLAWSNAGPLECRLRAIVPAWIELLFSYP